MKEGTSGNGREGSMRRKSHEEGLRGMRGGLREREA
jgi:hypothetical protein